MPAVFSEGLVTGFYQLEDRIIVMGAVPVDEPLHLPVAPEVTGTESFLERRELGLINLGGPGAVLVDGRSWTMNTMDGLYIGRGARQVEFASLKMEDPSRFYMISTTAHAELPIQHCSQSDTAHVHLGSPEAANERDLYKYIHPEGLKSCQLVMGCTRIAPGSVWNTMPAHRHMRRTEVYLYFDIDPDQAVFHFMGTPEETRHLVVRREEAVFSPSWSIHSGAGTGSYQFIWAMAGENQAFTDMDGVPIPDLR